jgi:suppressor of fused
MTDDERIESVYQACAGELRRVYGKQQPMHYGVIVPWREGGPDPIDGVSIYWHPTGHWHYVAWGLAEHDVKESPYPEISGYGFEPVLRLAAPPDVAALRSTVSPQQPPVLAAATLAPIWPIQLLNAIARGVLETKRTLRHGHFIHRPGDPHGEFWGVLADPELGRVQTVNGAFDYLALVSLTEPEFRRLQGNDFEQFVAEYRAAHPYLV